MGSSSLLVGPPVGAPNVGIVIRFLCCSFLPSFSRTLVQALRYLEAQSFDDNKLVGARD